jgi:cation transport ATPase
MKRLMLAAALAAAPAAVLATETLKLTVNGMVCSFCAQGIERKLSALPETEAVYVNLMRKVVAVQPKPGATLDANKMRREVKDAGYHVVRVEQVDQTVAELRATLTAARSK